MSRWNPFLLLLPAVSLAAGCGPPGAQLVSVQKIWDRAPHSAFTDLVRFQDRWFCTFREGESHVSSDGTIRIITSADGEMWSSIAHFPRKPGQDLRDPKLELTPDGRLMALALDRPWTLEPGLASWLAVLGLALPATALAYAIYFRILASAGATNLLLVTLLIPVSALLLGALVLGEEIGASALAGMTMIFLGLAAIDGRAFGWLRQAGGRLNGAGD